MINNIWLNDIPQGLTTYFNSIPVYKFKTKLYILKDMLIWFIHTIGCLWIYNPNNLNPILLNIIGFISIGITNNLNFIVLNVLVPIVPIAWLPIGLIVMPPIIPQVLLVVTNIVIKGSIWGSWIYLYHEIFLIIPFGN